MKSHYLNSEKLEENILSLPKHFMEFLGTHASSVVSEN